MSVIFRINTSEVTNNMKKLLEKAKVNCLNIMEFTVSDAEGYAKQNAPWHDRTGNARKSIAHASYADDTKVVGAVGIGVYYGLFLELCNQGKYRILRPTLDIYRYKLMDNMKGVLS